MFIENTEEDLPPMTPIEVWIADLETTTSVSNEDITRIIHESSDYGVFSVAFGEAGGDPAEVTPRDFVLVKSLLAV